MNVLRCIPITLAAILLFASDDGLGAETDARYEAVFEDGARIYGSTLQGWGARPARPRMGDTALNDAKRPLRWLRDTTLEAWSATYREHSIEFVGGDRIIGRLTGIDHGDGLYVPLCLLIKPAGAPGRSGLNSTKHVRVLPQRIQRVVFHANSRRELNAGMLYYRDGRKLPFVQLRWKNESVVLLLKNGSIEVKTSDISEIHLPRIEPWKAYYQELATLSPSCRSRLMRIETVSGLIATGSDLRSNVTWLPQPGTLSRIKLMERQIARLKTVLKQQQAARDKLQADCDKYAAEHKRLLEAARKTHARALAELQKKIDQQVKKDAASIADKQRKMDKQFASARQAMLKRLKNAKPDKSAAAIKTFDLKQAQDRKAKLQALQAEQAKFEQQRNKQLAALKTRQAKTLKRIESVAAARSKGPNTRLVHATAQFDGYVKNLKRSTQQYENARQNGGTIDTWRQIVQPVWSLDPLWVVFRDIRMRWSFDPAGVPLCRVRPVSSLSPPLLRKRTNSSWTGQMLRSGRQDYAWGFAVHAYSELRFPLPQCASAFRSRVGLDNIVGPGGCARARVFIGSTKNRPAYESRLLIGSKETIDTGSIRLAAPNDGPKLLVLQADPADRQGPPDADPLNIRDKLNWLDPRLELDRKKLQDQVRKHVGPLLAATAGWEIIMDRQDSYAWTSFFYEKGRPDHRSFWPMIQARDKPLKLRRKITLRPDDKHLAVHLGLPTDIHHRPGTITLHVGEREIPARKIPVRQTWRDRPTPLLFDLQKYIGKTVTLELTQPAGGKPLHWQAISISKVPPREYRLVDSLKAVGLKDTSVPHGLGQALQWPGVSDAEKRAAVEIHQMGAVVNFTPATEDQKTMNGPVNIMIGREWSGGDKSFAKASRKIKTLTSLKTLLVTIESGISNGEIAKLQGQLPKLKIIRLIPRVASPRQGAYRPVRWRNQTNREVVIIWIDQNGKLAFSSTPRVNPGQELRRSAYIGIRYEAHYIRPDAAKALDYLYSQPVSRFQVSDGGIWEIKPK